MTKGGSDTRSGSLQTESHRVLRHAGLRLRITCPLDGRGPQHARKLFFRTPCAPVQIGPQQSTWAVESSADFLGFAVCGSFVYFYLLLRLHPHFPSHSAYGFAVRIFASLKRLMDKATFTSNLRKGGGVVATYGDPSRFSKRMVSKAGSALASGNFSDLDREIVNNWRNSHAYILNTFQANLRGYIKKNHGPGVTFAQRLKRLNTIVDKLATGRAMDLASMHDLAGCRLIFDSIADIQRFRDAYHKTRAKHVRVDSGRYDYINNPKVTGYRGIHEVYTYVAQKKGAEIYNGLKIEIQYRTRSQHAWATAVEISDLLDGARIKFDQNANPKRERLFVLASEYLARAKEGMHGACPNLTDITLAREMKSLEEELGVINTLDMARRSATEIPQKKHVVLHFHNGELLAKGFTRRSPAISYRDDVEIVYPADDVVYVTAQSPGAIADAFRNYFRDARDFVESISPALA